MASMLSRVTKNVEKLPPRIVTFAPEKTGKTSLGCYADNPFYIMTTGETGLITLIDSGLVPPTDHYPEDLTEWGQLIQLVNELLNASHDRKTLIIDTGNGAENMLIRHVTKSFFKGYKSKFMEYGKGMDICSAMWSDLLSLLDQLRIKRGMMIIFLYHAKAKTFKDPAGDDYDQWRPEAQDKLWSLTHKWADAICFYGIKAQLDEDTEKATGKGIRFLQCSGTPAIVAGNRYGLPEQITSDDGAKGMWRSFAAALDKCRNRKPVQSQPSTNNDKPVSQPSQQPEQQPTKEQPPQQQPAAKPDGPTLEGMKGRLAKKKFKSGEDLGAAIGYIITHLPSVSNYTPDRIDILEAIREAAQVHDLATEDDFWKNWSPDMVDAGKAAAMNWLNQVK